MIMYSKDVALFNKTIGEHYLEYQKKLKQFCFLNGMTWEEDTLNETFVKCVDLISRKGLRDKTEKGCLDYFFQAFKFNSYQEHYQRTKVETDDDCDVYRLNIEDEDTIEEEEERAYNNTVISNYILQRVREEFDEIGFHIFRLRHLFSVDGKQLKFKEIKRITKVENTRSRLIAMNEFVATVVADEIKNKSERYAQHLKNYM
jgi:hypothetical protein